MAVVLMLAGCNREKPGSAPAPAGSPPAQGVQVNHVSAGHPHDDERHDGEHRHDERTSGEGVAGISLTPKERENIGFRTEAATVRPIEDVRKLNGIVKPHPDRVAHVTSRVTGTVVAFHFPVGAKVKKGEDLLHVQSVELERAELSLIQVENKLALTKVDLERAQKLVERGIAARRELLTLENQHREILNEIESLTRQLIFFGLSSEEIVRIRQEQAVTTLHLPAPIGGTIVERNVVLGQAIEPNAALMKIIDTFIMIVEGEAFEDILPLLQLGQKVRVVIPAYPDHG